MARTIMILSDVVQKGNIMNIKKFLLAAVMLAPLAAHSLPDEVITYEVPRDNAWVLTREVGVMGLMMSRYAGSDTYQSMWMPEIDIRYGPFHASILHGLGMFLPLDADQTLIVQPAIRWRTARHLTDSDRDAVQFVKDMRPTATLNIIYRPINWMMFNVRASEGFSQSIRGTSIDFGIMYRDWIMNDRLELTVFSNLIYGNQKYMQTYFGITPAQSIAYGFASHDARSGWRSWNIGFLAKYLITNSLSIDVLARYERLIDAAVQSPTVRTRDQFTIGFGTTYRF